MYKLKYRNRVSVVEVSFDSYMDLVYYVAANKIGDDAFVSITMGTREIVGLDALYNSVATQIEEIKAEEEECDDEFDEDEEDFLDDEEEEDENPSFCEDEEDESEEEEDEDWGDFFWEDNEEENEEVLGDEMFSFECDEILDEIKFTDVRVDAIERDGDEIFFYGYDSDLDRVQVKYPVDGMISIIKNGVAVSILDAGDKSKFKCIDIPCVKVRKGDIIIPNTKNVVK